MSRLPSFSVAQNSSCAIPLESKNTIDIILTLDFDIRAFFFGLVCHSALCSLVLESYSKHRVWSPSDNTIKKIFVLFDTIQHLTAHYARVSSCSPTNLLEPVSRTPCACSILPSQFFERYSELDSTLDLSLGCMHDARRSMFKNSQTFSSVFDVEDLAARRSSTTSSQPSLNALRRSYVYVRDRTSSPNASLSRSWIWVKVFLSPTQHLIA